MKRIDLHVHSSKSDGTLTPAQLVQHASACGLSAFALTDHDTTDGLPEAFSEAARLGIEVVPGIEFSTEYQGSDIHIIALEPDWENPDFQEKLRYYRASRSRRNLKMIERMADDGIDISAEQMAEAFPDIIWTRTHFARYLADHGYVAHMWDAFDSHIGPGCPYYVPREKINPLEAVALIRRFHGIPVLAHPFQYVLSAGTDPASSLCTRSAKLRLPSGYSDACADGLCVLLEKLRGAGLMGMEVYYSTHSPEQTDFLRILARQYDLLPGGGSDFHGTNKPDIALGTGKQNLQIPYELLTALRERRNPSTRRTAKGPEAAIRPVSCIDN